MILSEQTILMRWSPVQMAREIVRLHTILTLGPVDSIDEIKRHVLRRLLAINGGSRAGAAKAMGIGLRTVYRLVKQYNLKGYCVRDCKGRLRNEATL